MIQPLLGQIVGLLALALCLAAFASKRDDRLLAILIFANVAFAAQFFLLGGWVAGAISALIVVRILLVRRFKRNRAVMVAILIATVLVSLPGWRGPADLVPLAAGLIGTVAMFMTDGITLRVLLAVGATCWLVANWLTGSLGAMAAEALILVTNAVTILRLARSGPAAEAAHP